MDDKTSNRLMFLALLLILIGVFLPDWSFIRIGTSLLKWLPLIGGILLLVLQARRRVSDRVFLWTAVTVGLTVFLSLVFALYGMSPNIRIANWYDDTITLVLLPVAACLIFVSGRGLINGASQESSG
jgi:peptidoglycan/LPS O-acetylase OafA/YrhL